MTTPDAPLSSTPAAPARPVETAPAEPVVVARRSSGGRWVNLLLAAAAVLAIGGVAFALGRSTAPTNAIVFPDGSQVVGGPTGSFDPGAAPQIRPGGPGLLGTGGPTFEGTVTAVDADSMTIELAGGDEITVALDDETTYHEATAADPSAIAVGDDVAVQADGGRITIGQGEPDQVSSDLTADDVTVRR